MEWSHRNHCRIDISKVTLGLSSVEIGCLKEHEHNLCGTKKHIVGSADFLSCTPRDIGHTAKVAVSSFRFSSTVFLVNGEA